MDGGEGTVNDTPQSSDALSQPCAIYKSLKKFDSYLYVEKEGEFARVPAPLLQMLGRLEFVKTIALTPRLMLANADSLFFCCLLRELFYYLQLSPLMFLTRLLSVTALR